MSQTEVARLLKKSIKKIVEDWTDVVRDDPRIESDANLSKPELIDHVPAIVEEICDLISKRETPDVKNTHEARAGVYMRFHQGYKGRDLVRELSLLRLTLLEYLKNTSESADISSDHQDEAARVINLYLDEEMRYAIAIYGAPPSASVPPDSAEQER